MPARVDRAAIQARAAHGRARVRGRVALRRRPAGLVPDLAPARPPAGRRGGVRAPGTSRGAGARRRPRAAGPRGRRPRLRRARRGRGRRALPPPPTRPVQSRARRVAWLGGAAAALAIAVVLAARSDRAATWAALPAEERARVVERITAEARDLAGRRSAYAATRATRSPARAAAPSAWRFPGGARLPRPGRPARCATSWPVAGAGTGGSRRRSSCWPTRPSTCAASGARASRSASRSEAGPLAVRLGLDESEPVRCSRGARSPSPSEAPSARRALPTSCRDGGALDLRPEDSRFPF